MDGISAAASIVGLTAAAGQLLQATKTLYNFWSAVKELPTHLRWLSEDMACMRDILEYIEQQASQGSRSDGTSPIYSALQRYGLHLGNLEALVSPLRLQKGKGGNDKTWKAIKGVFSADKIKLYRESLEEAKATLLIAQTLLHQSVFTVESTCSKLIDVGRESSVLKAA